MLFSVLWWGRDLDLEWWLEVTGARGTVDLRGWGSWRRGVAFN